MGRVTSASRAGAIFRRVTLSQWASGSPSKPSNNVVIPASLMVSQRDSQSAGVSQRLAMGLESSGNKAVAIRASSRRGVERYRGRKFITESGEQFLGSRRGEPG